MSVEAHKKFMEVVHQMLPTICTLLPNTKDGLITVTFEKDKIIIHRRRQKGVAK